MKQQLEILITRYNSLSQRDRGLLLVMSILLLITLFYLMIWEPVHQNRDLQQQKFKSQQEIYTWMQSAAGEIASLKGSGSRRTPSNQPIALILENSANVSGLKQYINKIETSGKSGANVKIDAASFDQLLVWLNTLEQQHGVSIISASIERGEQAGTVSARLSFDKIQ